MPGSSWTLSCHESRDRLESIEKPVEWSGPQWPPGCNMAPPSLSLMGKSSKGPWFSAWHEGCLGILPMHQRFLYFLGSLALAVLAACSLGPTPDRSSKGHLSSALQDTLFVMAKFPRFGCVVDPQTVVTHPFQSPAFAVRCPQRSGGPSGIQCKGPQGNQSCVVDGLFATSSELASVQRTPQSYEQWVAQQHALANGALRGSGHVPTNIFAEATPDDEGNLETWSLLAIYDPHAMTLAALENGEDINDVDLGEAEALGMPLELAEQPGIRWGGGLGYVAIAGSSVQLLSTQAITWRSLRHLVKRTIANAIMTATLMVDVATELVSLDGAREYQLRRGYHTASGITLPVPPEHQVFRSGTWREVDLALGPAAIALTWERLSEPSSGSTSGKVLTVGLSDIIQRDGTLVMFPEYSDKLNAYKSSFRQDRFDRCGMGYLGVSGTCYQMAGTDHLLCSEAATVFAAACLLLDTAQVWDPSSKCGTSRSLCNGFLVFDSVAGRHGLLVKTAQSPPDVVLQNAANQFNLTHMCSNGYESCMQRKEITEIP